MKQAKSLKKINFFTCFLQSFVICIGLVFISCNNDKSSGIVKSNSNTQQQDDSLLARQKLLAPITGKLNVLFLENYLGNPDGSANPNNPHAQLQMLLATNPNRKKVKLVFHSFHNSTNNFTYGIWPSDKKNQKFAFDQAQVLNVSSQESGDPIDGIEFYFGDQQLVKSDIDVLRSYVNVADAKLILFKPVIISMEDSYGKNGPHVVYQLYKSNSSTLFVFDSNNIITKKRGEQIIPVITNPSPPKDAD